MTAPGFVEGRTLWSGDPGPLDISLLVPGSLEEAANCLRAHPGAMILASGQSLLPALRAENRTADILVDVSRIAALAELTCGEEAVRIGATVTINRFLKDRAALLLPLVADAARQVGNWTIRNRATFGGMLAWADPAAEVPLALRLLDAEVETTQRVIPAEHLIVAPFATQLKATEIIRSIRVPIPPSYRRFAFGELTRRPSGGRTLCALAVGVDEEARRVRVGMSGKPVTAWTERLPGEGGLELVARLLPGGDDYVGRAGRLVAARLIDGLGAS